MTLEKSSYIQFARKYRPANFEQLKGQDVLVKTLNNSIKGNRLAQAYLLSGIRGVGKTTTARIIAKTINCTDKNLSSEYITPCGKCSNCEGFQNGSHPDVFEIDAASRTSVDDVRSIISQSEYKPLLGTYKIFIIDEVHMLSKSAFNALLKLLEEPPAHVIFIFATTEVQKIPITVISRCQRYDLARLTSSELVGLLSSIAEKEAITYETGALEIIALRSDGSARDAITLLDQLASISLEDQNKISLELVNNTLGLVSIDKATEFLEYIIERKTQNAIEFIGNLYQKSHKLENFIAEGSDIIAYMVKCKLIENYKDLAYSLHDKKIIELNAKISLSKLSILWQIFSAAIKEIATAHNQLVAAEMLVIRAIHSNSLPTDETLGINVGVDVGIQKPVAQNMAPIAPAAPAPDIKKKFTVTEFLEYLHKANVMDIYYLLLNQTEIIKFSDNKMEISSLNCSAKNREDIVDALFKWTGSNWNVMIDRNEPKAVLKEQLMSKVKKSDRWSAIMEHFPEADISDILMKAT